MSTNLAVNVIRALYEPSMCQDFIKIVDSLYVMYPTPHVRAVRVWTMWRQFFLSGGGIPWSVID